MTDGESIGPIEIVVLSFPDHEPTGEFASVLMDVVDSGVVRLYDIVAVRKKTDGTVTLLELADVDGDGDVMPSAFAGARSGLLDEDDLAEVADEIEAGTMAVLIVYENAWAAPLVAAAHNKGGELVMAGMISAQDIIDRLDVLDEQA